VDFLHQFARPAVPKKDREATLGASGGWFAGHNASGPAIPQGGIHGKMLRIRFATGILSVRRHPSPLVASGKIMQAFAAFSVLIVLGAICNQPAAAQARLGPQGVEAEPNREQQWLVPSPDPETASRAVLFRPKGEGPFRLAVIAHATTQNVLRRAQMPQPEYRALAAWLVKRGFAVVVPERPGHGATGGKYLEDQGGCDEADYSHSGRATAAAIASALKFLREQSFVRQDSAVVVGHSAGGWGALALGAENLKGVADIIVFAPGRGGHANDFPNQVCAPHTLMSAAAEFGKTARVPVTWLVAANDTYFSPALSRQLADAFRSGGGKADFRLLPAYGGEGHWLAETGGGVKIAAPELDRALKALGRTPDKRR
jgi:dienelactone hydrolase